MVDGRRRDPDPRHRRDPRGPDPARVNDDLALDASVLRPDGPDRPPLRPVRSRSRARSFGSAHRERARRSRVRASRCADRGSRPRAPTRSRRATRGSPPASDAGSPPKTAVRPPSRCRWLERPRVADLRETRGSTRSGGSPPCRRPRAPGKLDRVPAEGRHRRRRVEHRDEAGRVRRGPARQFALVEQEQVGPARPCQMQGDAAACDAAPDHDHASAVGHRSRLRRKGRGLRPRPVLLRRRSLTPAGSPGTRIRP